MIDKHWLKERFKDFDNEELQLNLRFANEDGLNAIQIQAELERRREEDAG